LLALQFLVLQAFGPPLFAQVPGRQVPTLAPRPEHSAKADVIAAQSAARPRWQ
jgi:hypothetical protein